MDTTSNYPDGLTPAALALLDAQVSVEIALGEPTSGLLDGSARERRNRRILARALAGITPKYGVGVDQAAAELENVEQSARPVSIATALPTPVFGKSKSKGRKARRNAARNAARRAAKQAA
ncbi:MULTISPECIES: hypothetical protein [Saccharothrix]|uniref:hypothetical protein n=1 Tax=Saccharothrix TaxID=2071 RepID=UPI00093C2FBE|nr:hypothetical protein [Saccharothrix sp. CB00851]OKI38988.1 hypothetical protein A6A25_01965 [Saccharothrix sp. CB00851]